MSAAEQALAARAFLEMRFSDGEFNLSGKVVDVIRRLSDSRPTKFYLPWPVEVIPGIGRDISMADLATGIDTLRVEDVQYAYSSEDGVTVYIVTGPFDPEQFGWPQLVTCAEAGFLSEKRGRPPLWRFLVEAGLPATWEEYRKKKE